PFQVGEPHFENVGKLFQRPEETRIRGLVHRDHRERLAILPRDVVRTDVDLRLADGRAHASDDARHVPILEHDDVAFRRQVYCKPIDENYPTDPVAEYRSRYPRGPLTAANFHAQGGLEARF